MTCTDRLIETINPIINLFESSEIGICDKKMIKHLRSLNTKDYDYIISLISGQTSILKTYPYYSLYKVNIFNNKFSHHVDIFDDSGDDDRITIQYDDNHLMLHIFSVESLIFYIGDIKSKYIFLPIIFNSENKKNAHLTSLIIDKVSQKFYLYDPNGRSSYFNDIFSQIIKKENVADFSNIYSNIYSDFYSDFNFDGNELIDILIRGYVNDIKEKLNIQYEYVSSKIWNPMNNVINRPFHDNTEIGSGNCVITTFLFLHYLCLTNDNIKDIFWRLSGLDSGELLYLINNYSYWIYQILEPVINNKMKNPDYKKRFDEL